MHINVWDINYGSRGAVVTFVSHFQAGFYGPALCVPSSSLYSTVCVPFTTFQVRTRCWCVCFPGLCFRLLFMQVPVLRDQGDVPEIESVFRLGWNNVMTVGMCIPVCFTLKLKSGIEKRMLIALTSGVMLFIYLQMHFILCIYRFL